MYMHTWKHIPYCRSEAGFGAFRRSHSPFKTAAPRGKAPGTRANQRMGMTPGAQVVAFCITLFTTFPADTAYTPPTTRTTVAYRSRKRSLCFRTRLWKQASDRGSFMEFTPTPSQSPEHAGRKPLSRSTMASSYCAGSLCYRNHRHLQITLNPENQRTVRVGPASGTGGAHSCTAHSPHASCAAPVSVSELPSSSSDKISWGKFSYQVSGAGFIASVSCCAPRKGTACQSLAAVTPTAFFASHRIAVL